MECSLYALIACFGWSNLYMDGGIQYHDIGPRIYTRDSAALLDASGNLIQQAAQTTAVNIDALNPYGTIALGYEIRFKQITWRIEAIHISSLATDADRGVNAFAVSAKWFPFAR